MAENTENSKKFHCEWCDPAPPGVESAQVVGRCVKHGVGANFRAWGWLEEVKNEPPNQEVQEGTVSGQ